jgi:hypothetical protein
VLFLIGIPVGINSQLIVWIEVNMKILPLNASLCRAKLDCWMSGTVMPTNVSAR